MQTHRFASLVPLAVAAIACSAQAQTSELKAAVQGAVEGTIRAMQADSAARDGDLDRLTALVRQHFVPVTDFARTTRLAVGNAWRTATPDQQRALHAQFETLLVRSYATSLSQLGAQGVQFRFQPVPSANANDAVVQSRVNFAGDEQQIDYRLQRTPAGWKIYDINMMGAWLIEVYRKQFAGIVERGGVDGLVRYLTEHNARQGG